MKCKTQQIKAFKVDISRTNKEGEFHCPNCQSKITPDDSTEITYSVYETVMRDNVLDELVLCCNRCLCFIHLTGFYDIENSAE